MYIYWLAAYFGTFLIGLTKAGFATGLGMVTTPLISFVMPVQTALGIILPLLCLADLFTVGVYWKQWQFRLISQVLVGAVPGIVIGTFYIGTLSDIILKKTLGIITLFFVALLIIRQIWFPHNKFQPLRWHCWLIGTITGFTSTISHAAGPIIGIFLLSQKVDKRTFVATSAIYFTIGNWMKVPPYIFTGILNWASLLKSLILAPVIPLGVLIGWWANKRIPQKTFDYIVYVTLILTALKLIF